MPPPAEFETGRNSSSRNTGRIDINTHTGPPLTARSLVRHQIEQYKQQQLMEQQQKHLVQEYIRESQPSPKINSNDYDDMRLDVTPRRHEYEEMISNIVNQRIRSSSPVEILVPDPVQVEQNIIKQLSSEMLRNNNKEDDDRLYNYSVGQPKPPVAQKKFDDKNQRVSTLSNPNNRVFV